MVAGAALLETVELFEKYFLNTVVAVENREVEGFELGSVLSGGLVE